MTEYVGTVERARADVPMRRRNRGVRAPLAHADSGRHQGSSARLQRFIFSAVSVDAVLAAVVVGTCFALRDQLGADGLSAFVLTAPLLWVAMLAAAGTYQSGRVAVGTEEYRAIGSAAVYTFAAVAITSYLTKAELARGFVFLVVPSLLVASLVGHFFVRHRLYRQRERGECLQATVVVGRADSVAGLIEEINSAPTTGFRVVGACVSGLEIGSEPVHELAGVPVLGPPEMVLSAVDRLGAEVVAVSSDPDLVGHSLRRLGWALAERQVELMVSPGIVEVAGPRLSLRPAAGLSLLHVERPADGLVRRTVKRVYDFGLALMLLAALSPVFLVIAAAIKVSDRGPVFFRQVRVGAHGDRFRMVKFRTMVPNAERLLPTLSRDGQVNSMLFKDKQDPRVTSVGRVLRRLSLDELPQLFNVLRGEMSLVGPRPPLPTEVDQYEADAVQRLRVQPGMTGMWQVSGRSNLTWEQSLRLDLWYVDNWSPMLDLQILVRTFRAVFTGSGAY